jgi:hypothetical protein
VHINFAHRLNPDGTVEPICIHCFQTIATVWDEAELPKLEQEHYDAKIDYPRMLIEIGVCEGFLSSLYI